MKASTLFVKITKTVRVAPPCGWRGLALLSLAVCLLIPAILPQARAQELTFGQAAEEAVARIAGAFPVVQGSVVGVEGERVLIDLGAKKVNQGMELQVYREGDEVKHPVTGEVLGRRDKRLGLLRVVEVKDGFSETVIVSRQEGGNIRARDLVRVSSDRLLVALPLIDASGVKGANGQSVTKDLAIALAKTGRFIVIEDPLLKAALMGEQPSRGESFTDPSILKLLAEKAHVQLLVLGKLSLADQGLFLNLQVISVFTGAPLTVASVEVTGQKSRVMVAPSTPSVLVPLPGSGKASSVTPQPSLIHGKQRPTEIW